MRGSGFNFSQICSMVERAHCSGLSFTASDGNTVAELSHGTITLTDGARTVTADEAYTVNPRHDIIEPVSIAVSHHPVEEFRPERFGADVAYFDAAALEGNHVWPWRPHGTLRLGQVQACKRPFCRRQVQRGRKAQSLAADMRRRNSMDSRLAKLIFRIDRATHTTLYPLATQSRITNQHLLTKT